MQALNIALVIATIYVIVYYKSEGYDAGYAYAGSIGDSTGIRDQARIAGPFFGSSPEEMYPSETDPRTNISVTGVKWPNTI
jgi:hypothetical protein